MDLRKSKAASATVYVKVIAWVVPSEVGVVAKPTLDVAASSDLRAPSARTVPLSLTVATPATEAVSVLPLSRSSTEREPVAEMSWAEAPTSSVTAAASVTARAVGASFVPVTRIVKLWAAESTVPSLAL